MEQWLDYERSALERLRRLAPGCAVLLRAKGDFPLEGPGKIALYGSGGRRTVKGGTGSGDVNSRFTVTAEQGLREAGFTVTSGAWLDGYDAVYARAREAFLGNIRAEARRRHTLAMVLGMGAVMPEPAYSLPMEEEGDTAVYVLARSCGEGNDRRNEPGDYRLTDTEIRDILAAHKRYRRFMLVLNVGGPVDLTPVATVENVLLLGQLGAVTGWVLADLLLGRAYPSGKLASTWSAWDALPALGDFGGADDTRYREGVYVGYRYFDSAGVRPAFCFGYGLGYTRFALGRAETDLSGGAAAVRVPVTNVGDRPGRETVQVYVSVPWGRLDRPYQALAGFAKTEELAQGGTQTVTVRFDLAELAGYDTAAGAYILEPGRYILRVGTSSRDTVPAAALTLDREVTVRRVEHVGGTPDFEDWRPAPWPEEACPADLPVLALDPGALEDRPVPAPARPGREAAERAERLSDEELIHLCVGQYEDGAGLASVIGNAAQSVAGAAGETCSRMEDIPPLVMADGPAGLRLAQHYTRRGDMALAVGGTLPAGMEELMGPLMRRIMGGGGGRAKGPVLDQYCTAIPIGTALAQSWDMDLCRTVGDIVGTEMERFGVHLWLAPAMNIHRNPLCGRNFEYYSEDPLLTGLTAAAVTQGVQSHPGRGVTVKHFCCNNQETNRFRSNSAVSERALREIYLRGFGICLRLADPAALMTSYNLLNGEHTSQRPDLLVTLLRDEWGWGGLVMTDWVVAAMGGKGKYPMARADATLRAGNDLFMPGGKRDFKTALRALRDGTLPRERAVTDAAHVLEAVRRLRGKRE